MDQAGTEDLEDSFVLDQADHSLASMKQMPTSHKEPRARRIHGQEWPLELRSHGGGSVPTLAVLCEAA